MSRRGRARRPRDRLCRQRDTGRSPKSNSSLFNSFILMAEARNVAGGLTNALPEPN